MRITNTLTGKLEELKPVNDGMVNIYVCGVTPYADSHVGHAMSLMVYDVLVRYLLWPGNKFGGYEVNFVEADSVLHGILNLNSRSPTCGYLTNC